MLDHLVGHFLLSHKSLGILVRLPGSGMNIIVFCSSRLATLLRYVFVMMIISSQTCMTISLVRLSVCIYIKIHVVDWMFVAQIVERRWRRLMVFALASVPHWILVAYNISRCLSSCREEAFLTVHRMFVTWFSSFARTLSIKYLLAMKSSSSMPTSDINARCFISFFLSDETSRWTGKSANVWSYFVME